MKSWKIKAASCFIPGLMFNTGIGQHILKNPLIVNSIIDKVGVDEETHSVCVSSFPEYLPSVTLCCVPSFQHLGKLRQGDVLFKAILCYTGRLLRK